MPKLTVYNIKGQESGSMDLPEFFGKEVNKSVIHQVVVMYQANKRQGNADTKIRSEISGGNKKPFRQKGTGRARQGSSRSPLMRHGGVVFGPQPRDFSYTVSKKIRVAALRESLNAKFKTEGLVCVDALKVDSSKTRDFVKILNDLKVSKGKVLALFDGCTEDVFRSCRNLPRLNMVRVIDVNALDILKTNKVLATKSAMEKLLKRLQ